MNPKPTINIPRELLFIKVTDVLDVLPHVVSTFVGNMINIDNVRITWMQSDIQELSSDDLSTLADLMARSDMFISFDIIAAEGWRRVNGEYPSDFKQTIKDYIRKPETWRLKIHY